MNPSTLITDHLDTWSSAIKAKSSAGRGGGKKQEFYGIKKLRELILELAVRGLLVPQDAEDEPASELLKKIRAEEARLVKAGETRKRKSLPEIKEAEYPFSIPQSWDWIRLGSLGFTQTGGTPSKSNPEYFGDDIPFIKPADISNGSVDYQNEALSIIGSEKLGRAAPAQSLLMVCIGTIGKCALINRDCTFNQQINSVTPYVEISAYLYRAVSAPFFQSLAWNNSSSTTIAILNKGKWESIPLPLPPLAEQHRIVAKVDELMALCDQLEQQQEDSVRTHGALVQTLLGALTAASERGAFAEAWQRIASHFDTLFTTESSIAQLKQTILQLAVMGKLVEQDAGDEDASALIRRVSKSLPDKKSENSFLSEIDPLITNETVYELPEGWAWIPLGHIGIWATGCGFPTKYQGEEDREFLFCKVSDMNLPGNEVKIHRTVHTIDSEVLKKIRARPNPVGTVIFPKIGGAIATHKRRIVIKPTIIDNNCSGIQPIGLTDNRWLLLFMRSLDLTKYQSGTSVPAVSQSSLNPIRVGLPPLAEQHRIVAKVDELMTLCDRLKANLQSAQTTQLHLADTLVEQAVG